MTEQNLPPQQQAPDNCLPSVEPSPLSKLAFNLILVSVLIWLVLILFSAFLEHSDALSSNSPLKSIMVTSLAVIGLGAFLIPPFIAIASLLQISLSDNLKGIAQAFVTIMIGSFLLMFIATAFHVAQRSIAYRMVCGSNLSSLSKALMIYAAKHHERLPDKNWCDLLIKEASVTPGRFVCKGSEARLGECSYALNQAAIGIKISELPSDLVLMFETDAGTSPDGRTADIYSRNFPADSNVHIVYDKVYKDRWNQVGGPEILSLAHHKNQGCNVLYAGTGISFVTASELPRLRWVIDEPNFVFPTAVLINSPVFPQWREPALVILSFAILAVLASTLILCRKAIQFTPICLIALPSVFLGGLFGSMAQLMYSSESYNEFDGLGMYGGAVLGLLFAFTFVPVVKLLASRFEPKKFVLFTTAIGMFTGSICSTLLHGLLMIANVQAVPLPMLIGLPFGILSGAILGYMTGKKIQYDLKLRDVHDEE